MAWATRERSVVNPARFGNRSRPKSRKNKGEQFSWVLNPGKGRKMATKKKKKSWSASHHHKAGTKGKHNPGRKYSTKVNRRRSQRNPMGFNLSDLVQSGIFGTVGAVGSKLLTQVVLGASNTGIMGYLGNAVAGVALGITADKVLKNPKAAFAIYVGTAIQLVLRAITDFTPYGQAVALTGVGDYQVSNFVTPQRYVDALHGAMIQVPAGFGPGAPMAIQSAGVPADHASGVSGMSIYGSGGSIYE